MFPPISKPSPFRIWVVAVLLAAGWLGGGTTDVSHAAKAKIKPPDLKIVSIDAAPLPYVPTKSPMTLTIMVELPRIIPEDSILDVTTLITSPSRTTFRLLTSRQMLPSGNVKDGDLEPYTPRRLEIVQTWDGTDNHERIVSAGLYSYQVQAKLMVMSKFGTLLTRMNAWKKRGNFEVRTYSAARSDRLGEAFRQ
jgi:hypothetical protein